MKHTSRLPFIGITGGIGAGKSTVLSFIEKNYNACIVRADDVAKDLIKKGTPTYEKICEAFSGLDIFEESGEFDRNKLSKVIFTDINMLQTIDNIVHPAVKERVKEIFHEEDLKENYDYFFLEAALLIEEHYDEICDELWYIYASEDTRRARLKESRGYTDEKITGIFSNQQGENVFRTKCKKVINNDGDLAVCEKEISTAIDGIRH
ncbi:MAG: dephospho-CoA kinase [Lachnospiraceae bacterium]|nr:dephospho-CoA kinase [Lachnospiraceae bacterium]